MSWNVIARSARRIAVTGAVLLTLFVGAGFGPAATGATAATLPAALMVTGSPQTVSETVRLSSTTYIIDSQQVTLDGGYDVPLGNGWHDIDMLWTITSKIDCRHAGTDICAAGVLRYPGIDCVLPNGDASSTCGGPGWVYSEPQDDPKLKCPAPPKVPAHFTQAGQSVKICTSSLFFENQTATAMTYFMGYDNGYDSTSAHHLTASWGITDPWNPGTGQPVHAYHSTACSSAGSEWHGNVPPTCAELKSSGPFRRVFSDPGYFGTLATITLPRAGANDVAPTLSDLPQMRSQAGYAYLEAWLGSGDNAPVYEFGLVYHQVGPYAGEYSLYWSPGSTPKVFVPSGGAITLQMYDYPAGHTNNPQWPASDPAFPQSTCQNHAGCLILRATENGKVVFDRAIDAKSWAGNKLMFARVTSIAQSVRIPYKTDGNYFDDGALFGPVTWSAKLAKLSHSGISAPAWDTGGEQSWPADSSIIRVFGRSGDKGLAGEQDAIDLLS